MLVAGVDVQDDRLECEVLGIGRDEETWSIDYFTLNGDPSSPAVWQDLDSVLFDEYEREDGEPMSIKATAIDTGGHHTQSVYRYVKAREMRRVFGIKGVGGEGRPLVGRPSKNNIGKVRLFPVGSDTAKELVYGRLKIQEPGPGYCHFPDHYVEEYFKQLTAEKLVTKYVRGHSKRIWVKSRPRNEALDVRCYALAAYAITGSNVNQIASKMARRQPAIEQAAPAEETQQKQQPSKRRRPTNRSGGFVTNWR